MRFIEICACTGERETLKGAKALHDRLLFRYPTIAPTALNAAMRDLQGNPGNYESRHYWYRRQRREEPEYSVTAC